MKIAITIAPSADTVRLSVQDVEQIEELDLSGVPAHWRVILDFPKPMTIGTMRHMQQTEVTLAGGSITNPVSSF